MSVQNYRTKTPGGSLVLRPQTGQADVFQTPSRAGTAASHRSQSETHQTLLAVRSPFAAPAACACRARADARLGPVLRSAKVDLGTEQSEDEDDGHPDHFSSARQAGKEPQVLVFPDLDEDQGSPVNPESRRHDGTEELCVRLEAPAESVRQRRRRETLAQQEAAAREAQEREQRLKELAETRTREYWERRNQEAEEERRIQEAGELRRRLAREAAEHCAVEKAKDIALFQQLLQQARTRAKGIDSLPLEGQQDGVAK